MRTWLHDIDKLCDLRKSHVISANVTSTSNACFAAMLADARQTSRT